MFDYGDPIVTFGEDLTYGCGVTMNRAQLEEYCNNGTQIISYPLFSNLDFFTKYGQFGNANIYNP